MLPASSQQLSARRQETCDVQRYLVWERKVAHPFNICCIALQVAAAAAADAAAEPLSAAPSSASALKAEVRRLRVQLTQRDLLVDQLRGDVAALKVRGPPCIVCD